MKVVRLVKIKKHKKVHFRCCKCRTVIEYDANNNDLEESIKANQCHRLRFTVGYGSRLDAPGEQTLNLCDNCLAELIEGVTA